MAVEIVDSLPSAKVKRAIEYLEYLKDDYNTFDVNEKIKSGHHDVKLMRKGKIKIEDA